MNFWKDKFKSKKCVLCDLEAITTAVQIPVCKKHHDEVATEGRKYLPMNERVVYKKLLEAEKKSRT
jgi:hypothetical protein